MINVLCSGSIGKKDGFGMDGRGIVYCDFDGTFIKEDIEKMWLDFLMKSGKLRWYQYALAAVSIPASLIRKKRYRGCTLKSWTVGVSRFEIDILLKEFLADAGQRIHVNETVRNLLLDLRREYDIMLLTGSYERLVRACVEYLGCSELFAGVIGTEVKPNGMGVLRHPYGKDKCRYIDTSRKTVGVGNEFADSFFLALCGQSYVVSGDAKLIDCATKKKWRII